MGAAGPVRAAPTGLNGVVGQPDAGVMSDGDFTISGGFWMGGEAVLPPPILDLYLPLILR